MIKPRAVINNCYILQEHVTSDGISEYWRASAMFSATLFLVRFFKESVPAEAIEDFRALVIKTYGVTSDAVLDILEADRFEGKFFVSSGYGGGLRLRELFGTGFTANLDHVCRYAIELAKGLDEFHKNGIAYGTLTADCIWVTREESAITGLRFMKPGDLLFSKMQPRDDPVFVLEHQGYFAPEVKGEASFPIDARSDVYSLGIHLFRFLTGLMPFRGQSVVRALDKAVSVLHVSNALTRRGIPEELVRIVVRSVRHNPKLRYQSVVDFVADLSAYADQRRNALIKSGMADPFAELAGLNKSKEREGVTQMMRALDTVDYFKAAAAAAKGDTRISDSDPSLRFPISWKPEDEDAGELLELEELECISSDDDDTLTTDDYLALSRKAVGIVPANRVESQTTEHVDSAATVPQAPAAPVPVPEAPPAVASVIPRKPASNRKKKTAEPDYEREAGIIWEKTKIKVGDMPKKILGAFKESQSGKGSFRFIREMKDQSLKLAFARAFRDMAEKAVVIQVDIREEGIFGKKLERELRESLDSRPSRERRRMAMKTETCAGSGLFSVGGNSVPEGKAYAEMADAFVKIPTRKNPLILILRGIETCDTATHDLLLTLAPKVMRKPLCVFAFYGDTASQSWHILSTSGM